MSIELNNAENHQRQPIPIEAVATYPLPGMNIPGSFEFTPDDSRISYLFSPTGDLHRQLFVFDPETSEHQPIVSLEESGATEENLSSEEKLQRERRRQRELGVTSYRWSSSSSQLLIPSRQGLLTKDSASASLRLLVSSAEGPILDARFSPDGQSVSYVQDAELYVIPARGGEPTQLTSGARSFGLTHGLAEYIAQEEMGRYRGYWWSGDSKWLAFAAVDETHIPSYRIMHQGKEEVGSQAQEDHRYPFAGTRNAVVRLGVVPAAGGQPVWMDLGADLDFYLARVNWLQDGRLVAQKLNREQTQLDLIAFEPGTGSGEILLQETSDVWINLHDIMLPVSGDRFLWASERTGYRHLYLYHNDGTLIRQLTSGQWMVDSVAGVDTKNETVYFTGTRNGPTEQHLYAVSLQGGEVCRITQEPGIHSIILDRAKQRFIDAHQAVDHPPVVTLRSLTNGQVLCPIYDQPDNRISNLNLSPPELVTLPNRHGTELHGAIYRPDTSSGSAPFPTVVSVYGGPHAQRVTNSWALTVNMRAQYLRSQGFLVFMLDNRGSARRGLEFESHVKHKMGHAEVDDQVDGVRWLIDQGLANDEKIGIYGWSYGGYMALMCLARASDTFHAAAAGAPVTHWDGYDTCYTERYMGTPESNPTGYAQSSVMHHVDTIKGELLLVHGLIDENVHFRHTARLINALIAARKPYQMLLFPDERHMPRKLADRVYMEEQIADFFARQLLS